VTVNLDVYVSLRNTSGPKAGTHISHTPNVGMKT
jgi:hypothetical protein